ncbi:MAG: hypothetical protein KDD82_30960 [Planctomycetes bacterium]|nr:hypothetical protein [Planctomycetota bacterium]
MPAVPGIYRQDLEDRRYVLHEQGLLRGQEVVLDEETYSPLPPNDWIPPGTVVVRRQSAGRYVHPTHPDAARNQPAAVSSLQPADQAWAGTVVTASLTPGLGFAVPLDQSAVDNPAVIDQLNQDPAFVAHFLADEDQAGNVRVRTRAAGADQQLSVSSSLAAAFGPEGRAAHGTDADYRVTDAWAAVRELDGSPSHYMVPTLLAGHFDESELVHLTPEARVVLSRRGSIFG